MNSRRVTRRKSQLLQPEEVRSVRTQRKKGSISESRQAHQTNNVTTYKLLSSVHSSGCLCFSPYVFVSLSVCVFMAWFYQK
jgi:hypothetical protein